MILVELPTSHEKLRLVCSYAFNKSLMCKNQWVKLLMGHNESGHKVVHCHQYQLLAAVKGTSMLQTLVQKLATLFIVQGVFCMNVTLL